MDNSLVSAARALVGFAAPYKRDYVLSVMIAVFGVICSVLPYWFIGQIVVHLVRGGSRWEFYLTMGGLIALCWVGRYVFHAVSTERSHSATFSVITEVRLRLADKLARAPLGYTLETPSGALKDTLIVKTMDMEPTLAHLVPELTSNLLVGIATIGYLFVLDWRMGLASLITIPLGLLCYAGMMRGYTERYATYIATNKHLNAVTVEYVEGIEVIKMFNRAASSYAAFSDAVRAASDAASDWTRSCQGWLSAAMTTFPATLLFVLPIGCLLVAGGGLSTETFILTIVLSFGVMPPLLLAISYTDKLSRIGTTMGEIASVFDQPDLKRPAERCSVEGARVRVRDVSFSYGETEVLHSVSFYAEEGEVTALVGPSGSGKSTIAKLIASLWDVGEGCIEIGGVDLRTVPLAQANDMIAYVAQDNYLFDDTVMENIRMGRIGATDEEVISCAKATGCHDFIGGLEKGYATRVGDSGGHLSGGERQRIAIARAMLKDAPIVILDEATAYLDPENEASIQRALSSLAAGRTLIVIAHRLSTVKDADRIVVMDDGRVVGTGTHEELLETCALYRTMWEANLAGEDEIPEKEATL